MSGWKHKGTSYPAGGGEVVVEYCDNATRATLVGTDLFGVGDNEREARERLASKLERCAAQVRLR